MSGTPTLTTERLLLRPFRHEDSDAFADMCADEDVMEWVGGTMDRGQSWRHMAALSGHWALRGYGRWALELRATGEFVGHTGLWFPEGWPRTELGWTLARRFWGRGLATEAARASLDYAWREHDFDSMIALIEPRNERSGAVAGKLGMAATGDFFDYREHRLAVHEVARP